MNHLKKMLSGLIIILLALSILCSSQVYAIDSVPNEVMESAKSVVRIIAEYKRLYSSGSGFVVSNCDNDILIVTNYHVVEDEPLNIYVYVGKEDKIEAEIVCFSKQKDLCLLKLKSFVDISPITIEVENIDQGQAVYAIGFPGSADYLSNEMAQTYEETTITDGIISAIREMTIVEYGSPISILQINADINHGNSGGPLLNSSGKVVGVCTYSVVSAAGINGAIDAAELIDFLLSNDIKINGVDEKTEGYGTLIITLIVIALVFCMMFILYLKKKGLINLKLIQKKTITADAFFKKYPQGMSVEEAVSFLMPIAVELRDLHKNGKLYLQLSPETIQIDNKNGVALKQKDEKMAGNFASGFTAPEVYKDLTPSVSSDVYSFGALLYRAITGRMMDNSLVRDNNIVPFPDKIKDETIKEVITIALSLDKNDRFSSMQEIIDILTPYNRTQYLVTVPSPVISSMYNNAILPRGANYTQRKKSTLILTSSIVVLGIISIIYGASYFSARKYAENGDFKKAEKKLFLSFITEIYDPKLDNYISAGLEGDDRNYESAANHFSDLGDYLNSLELRQENMSKQALQLLSKDKYEEALSLYDELISEDYDSAEELKNDALYKQGCYFLYESEEYENAETIFSDLIEKKYEKAEDMLLETYYTWGAAYYDEEEYISSYKTLQKCKSYDNTKELLEALEELLYYKGIELYESGNYKKAKEYFDNVKGYERSDDYQTLISAQTSSSHSKTLISALSKIIDLEDAGSLIFKTNNGFYFMSGNSFKSGGAYIKFYEKNDDWWANWSISGVGSGQWYIEEGTFYTNNIARFYIRATSYNTVVIQVISTGKTYTLTRS